MGEVEFEKLAKENYIDLSSGERIGRDFVLDVITHDIPKRVRKISSRPFLIVHGTKDELVPISHSEKLFDLVKGPKEKFSIEGADHAFNRRDWSLEAINRTAEWFKENLT